MVQRGLTGEALRPDMIQEFLPADHTVPMLDEIEQNIEHLRLHGTRGSGMMEFVEMGMQSVVIEQVHHSHLAAV
jgi:hypothetical protein